MNHLQTFGYLFILGVMVPRRTNVYQKIALAIGVILLALGAK